MDRHEKNLAKITKAYEKSGTQAAQAARVKRQLAPFRRGLGKAPRRGQ
jgi:hypothetical protein